MDGNLDVYNILDGLERTMRETVNSRYLEAINEMNDGLNKVVQRCISNADTFDTSIRMAIRECKVTLTSSPKQSLDLNHNMQNQQIYHNNDNQRDLNYEMKMDEKPPEESSYQSNYQNRNPIREEEFEIKPDLSSQPYNQNDFDSSLHESKTSPQSRYKPTIPNLSAIRQRTDANYDSDEEEKSHNDRKFNNEEDSQHPKYPYIPETDEEGMDASQKLHRIFDNNAMLPKKIPEAKQDYFENFSLYPSNNESRLPDQRIENDRKFFQSMAPEEMNGHDSTDNNSVINKSESERIYNECFNDKKAKMDERMRREEQNTELNTREYQPPSDNTNNVFYNNNTTSRQNNRQNNSNAPPPREDYQDMATQYAYGKPKAAMSGIESGVVVTDSQTLDNGLVIKTYECKDCGMQSEFKNNIELHYKNKHAAVKPYNCSFCDFGVARRDYLRTHIRKKHPEVESLPR